MRAEFDTDNNGTISKEEFMDGMRSLADKQMNAAVNTTTGAENFVEFQEWWAHTAAKFMRAAMEGY